MWKDVVGYAGLYKVSSDGRVYSEYTSKILTPAGTASGYLGLTLCRNKKRRTMHIHKLVAEAFIPRDTGGKRLVVNHINGDKQCNRVSNLEWVTYKENTAHAINTGLMPIHGEAHPFYGKKHRPDSIAKMSAAAQLRVGKLNSRSTPIKKVDLQTGEVVAIYDSQGIAARECNLSQGNISMVLRGTRISTGGYAWQYVV